MTDVNQLVTEHLDIWTAAIEKKSSAGRGKGGGFSLYGIKKLRELILELAVCGKLVPQVAQDGAAQNELAKLERQTAKIALEGKFKRLDSSIEEPSNPSAFDLPSTWLWCSLDSVAAIARGGSPRPIKSYITDAVDGVPWIKIGDSVRGSSFIESTAEKIRPDGLKKSRLVFPGDLVLSNSMSFGFPYIMKIEGAIHDGWLVIRTPEGFIDKRFLQTVFLSPLAKRQFEDAASGAVVQNLNADKVRQLRIPLPPLAEQRRIVTKVDELLALCDALEEQAEDSLKAHQTLVETCLATLTNSRSPGELTQNWTRIEAHFDTLFMTEKSVAALKEAIIQLAISGALTDRSARTVQLEELHSSIHEERLQIGGSKSKKKPDFDLPRASDFPFMIPKNWGLTRFGLLALKSEAGWSPKCPERPREGNEWGVLKVSAVSWGAFNPDQNKVLPENLEPRSDIETKAGDFLISRANTSELVARSVVVPKGAGEKLMLSDKLIRIRFSKKVSADYLNLVNMSQPSRDYYREVAGGTSSSMKNVSRAHILNLVVPLPPLEEQEQIVAKVRKLFRLCDELQEVIPLQASKAGLLADLLTSKIH